jgi:hypothetical protein
LLQLVTLLFERLLALVPLLTERIFVVLPVRAAVKRSEISVPARVRELAPAAMYAARTAESISRNLVQLPVLSAVRGSWWAQRAAL